MEPDWWLELENTYEDRMKQRAQLLIDYGSAVLQALPGSELACKELMEMVLQFLCVRYPHYFSLNSSKTVFHNAILQTQTDLEKTQPLHVIFQNIPEDFAIMLRDERTGLYIFRAGIICSSLGWSLASKIGLPLHEIHAPIPDYKAKMQFSMDRYFYFHFHCPHTTCADTGQILRQETHRQAHSTRLLGSRSRPAALHAAR
jgi:hypothetical protein